VVLVLDGAAGSAELPSRTAQLADEFGRQIAHSVPRRAGAQGPQGRSIWRRAQVLVAPDLYRVAVSGPVGWQTGCGGLPVVAHPLPVEIYVAPGR
jgi:hypothetical protein